MTRIVKRIIKNFASKPQGIPAANNFANLVLIANGTEDKDLVEKALALILRLKSVLGDERFRSQYENAISLITNTSLELVPGPDFKARLFS